MRVRALSSLTFLAAVLVAGGCSSGTSTAQSQPATSAAACRTPEPATLPQASGSLTEADSGAFCLGVGQILDVFLTVPANSKPGTRWNEIKLGDSSVAGYGNSGVLTPPIGVTPGVFVGTRVGVTTLSSTLMPAGTTWTVTLVVK